jgi:triosephosphate isomerase
MNMRRKLIAGNWKMNKNLEAAIALSRVISASIKEGLDADIVLFPPAPFLAQIVQATSRAPHPIGVGAQNFYFEASGAFTGEISAAMVLSCGARWILIGHSERRHIFHEDDDLIAKKVQSACRSGLHTMVCVGETLAEREAGKTEAVVLGQTRCALQGLNAKEIAAVTLAYEPVWAIGTGRTATPEQGQEVHGAIRKELARWTQAPAAESLRILYGGSVNPANVKDLLSQPDIDGVLVGGASLEADKFLSICHWQE